MRIKIDCNSHKIKRSDNKMKKILLFIWQLPQNILGLILGIFLVNKRIMFKTNHDCKVYSAFKNIKGVVLGKYIYLNKKADSKIIKNKIGFFKLSCILGWFYLPIVFLLGFLLNGVANKLGGLK
jgi:hypothetical protein